MLSRCVRIGQAPQDVADVGDEAEVEHAIGFIEHQHLHRAQIDHVLLDEVDDAAGRAHQDIDAGFEVMALLFVIDAAEGEAELQAGVRAEHFGVAMDLNRQLARWSNDQSPRCIQTADGGGGSRIRRAYIATRNAAVFPVPVCACPATSRPARACGKVCAWIGVQRSKDGIGQALLQSFGQMQAGKGQLG